MSCGIRNLSPNSKGFFKKFSFYIPIAVSVALLGIPESISNHIKITVASPLAPVQNIASKPVNYFGNVIEKIALMIESADRKEKLEKEVFLLQNKVVEYKNTINILSKKLESMTELRKNIDNNENPLIADIIGHDTSYFRKSILINIGKKQGASVDDAVVFGSALVGRITAAGNSSSRAMLITDPASNIPSRFLESRIQGMVQGTGDDTCKVKYISRNVEIKEGDVVISSGIGGIFPKSIYIGDIVAIEDHGAKLFKDIKLKPKIDFSKMEHVLVIKKSKVQSNNN
jgi:rod shape-determining protein MreC